MTGELHTLFDRHRWLCTDEEYQILRPSMRLSSYLIGVGMQWIANFLPADKIYNQTGHRYPPVEVPFNDKPSAKDIQIAKDELDELADSITWRVNYEMYRSTGFDGKGEALEWMGITRLVDSGPSSPSNVWQETRYEEILDADQISQDEGKDRRPLVIGIMGEVRTPLAPDKNIFVKTIAHESILHARKQYIGDDTQLLTSSSI